MPDPRTDLRGAVARSDGLALVALLTDPGGRPVHALQLAGDGLLGAVAASVPGAAPLAQRWIEARTSGTGTAMPSWPRRSGPCWGPSPSHCCAPCRWTWPSSPASSREIRLTVAGGSTYAPGRSGPRRHWTTRTRSARRPTTRTTPTTSGGCGSTRTARAPATATWRRSSPRWTNPSGRTGSAVAITGKGAFRRFRDVIARWPELAQRWYAFSEDRALGRARVWLADNGYTPDPPRSRP